MHIEETEPKQIGFFSFSGIEGKEEAAGFFRDILARALISETESERLAAIFDKCAGFSLRGGENG